MRFMSGVDVPVYERLTNLQVKRWKKKGRTVRTVPVVGGMLTSSRFNVFNNNVDNLLSGVEQRVLFTYNKATGCFARPPAPEPECRIQFLEECRKFSKRVKSSTCITAEQFVAMYTGRKRTIYENALQKYNLLGLRQKDSEVKVFLKCEKIDTSKPRVVPRIIQPRDPVYNIALGRYVKKLEHKIYRALDRYMASKSEQPTVMKGYTCPEIGGMFKAKWDRFSNPCFVGLDAHRFDQHVHKDILKATHEVYLRPFQGASRRELRKILRMQLKNKCNAASKDGTFTYKVEGQVMSGDMTTASGDIIIMCLLVRRFVKEMGIDCEIVNCGDDTGIIMESDQLHKMDGLAVWFERFGFQIKIEPPVHVLERCEFCQMQPVCVNGVWTMVRKPGTILQKDAILVLPFEQEWMLKRWCYEVGVGGIAMYGNVPVIGSYYRKMKEIGKGVDRPIKHHSFNAWGNNTKRYDVKSDKIDDSTRVSFGLAFGIPPSHQVGIESEIDSLDIGSLAPTYGNIPSLIPYL